jgi:hypothetical protein
VSRSTGTRGLAWRLVLSTVLAAALLTVPADWLSVPVRAALGCTTDGEVRSSTCRLVDGQTVEGRLDAPGGSQTFRLDAFEAETVVALQLSATDGSTRVAVTNWRGETLGAAQRADAAPTVTLTLKLPLPGAYGVTVSGDAPEAAPIFQLRTTLRPPSASSRLPAIWPPLLGQSDGLLTGERQLVRTPRGGAPSAGVAVADVRFERIVGPSALTVRFRYEPEAGGGTGYILAIDPFGGVASLDSFDEGQRRPMVTHRPLPLMPSSEQPNRLILRASGPQITASLDGETILEANDDRYPRGLIAVGVVTWSDPAAVTFDHLQVTGTAP